MAIPRRFTYVDFTKVKQPPMMRQNLNTAFAVTDTHIGEFQINDNDFECLNIGALSSMGFGTSATGMLLPLGTADGNGLALCQGSVAAAGTKMQFLTGTDAFYLKVKLIQSVLADTDVMVIGFREAGTTQVTTTPATALTDYDHKALIGVTDNAGRIQTLVSLGAGLDTATTATGVSVTTVAKTYEVYVSAAGVVTFLLDGAADTLLSAAATQTLVAAKTMVPHLCSISTGAGVEKVELVTWECGLQ